MQDFDQLLKEHGYHNRFHEFSNLMRFRIREILLVSSLYDSFILEEDGRLYEKIHSEYHDLNISQAPGITRVSTGRKALELAQEKGRFNLILTTLHLGDMDALQFIAEVKEADIQVPVVLLTYDNREMNELISRFDTSDFDKIFIWQGDFRILISMIKSIEDRMNVDHDTKAIGVQSIVLVEDNVHFYSSYLPMIYTEVFRHSQSLISEGVNVPHKLLRMRARPKILHCTTYEEAMDYYNAYQDCIMGVITDLKFPRKGKLDPEAGIRLARRVKSGHFDIPILLQSDSEELAQVARELGLAFILKSSPMLLRDLQHFIMNSFSFGDFIFCMPDGKEVGSASGLRTLEEQLGKVPDQCLTFHAERNHFSNWLKARTEFWLAHQLRPQKVGDFTSVHNMRKHLITTVHTYRRQRSQGTISDFHAETFDTQSSFARVGGGSLGGKARGLAFTNTLINNFKVQAQFKDVRIFVPPALVLGTDVFDQFVDENNLRDFAIHCEDDREIMNRFLAAKFPEAITHELLSVLLLLKEPLAVRSSSLLEDSRYLPFAGIYSTYMLPNSHRGLHIRLEALLRAVKRVYASTFSQGTKAYIRATHYRLEEEKMAVIIQKLVGLRHEGRYYPDLAGVARSHNFYPRPPMDAGDGIASVGLGLGKQVIEGGKCMRFCPRYPTHAIQFADIEDTLKYSQNRYYALDMEQPDVVLDPVHENKLSTWELDTAEKDGTLHHVGSTYSVENETITDGLSRPGPRLVTFAPILKSKGFPLPEILQMIMDIGSWGMSSPVEIEFAANLSVPRGERREFGILQVRPLVKSHELDDLNVEGTESERLVCQCPQVMGNGRVDEIHDVIVVHPDRFERGKSLETALEVGQYNNELLDKQKPYLLIGMGRWGSADPWLGIPVKWEQISGARVIIETGFTDFKVIPSQGTHFFQNLTSFRIGYFTINAHFNEGFVDWNWLFQQPFVSEKEFTRHIRFDLPLVTKMNGHTHEGIIFKPGAEQVVS